MPTHYGKRKRGRKKGRKKGKKKKNTSSRAELPNATTPRTRTPGSTKHKDVND